MKIILDRGGFLAIIFIDMLKKLFSKYITFMVISDSNGEVKNKKISYGTLLVISLALFIFISFFIYILIGYQKDIVKEDKYENMVAENIILKEKYRNLKKNSSRNQKIMYNVLNSIDSLLILNNLPPTSEAIKEMGIGGTTKNWDSEEDIMLEPSLKNEIEDISTMITKTEARIDFAKTMLTKIKNSDELDKKMWDSVPTNWPVYGWITSGYGFRHSPMTGEREHHHGIDIAQSVGAEVRSPANGKVIYAGYGKYWGKTILIKHSYGIKTRYAHLQNINVGLGEKVKKGQIIGTVGNTGNSNGPHLHYEVRVYGSPVDPMKYIIAKK
ncbi:MAG: M23 family metallopeptidase [Candidatus Mcinerneyibacterium aminivorans]|jgi:hypothetical protein|uniref:M23 family metallopeptidase n=1 Tax=Candidatus Mcinerneyibacterium aminivorans TaxID=2703815 RepID=A0A5D0MBB8_9BACT|nr:MAG: M23 family metallopeptidase [Candidatus Mcinerneyibacterium aminivorans]